MSKIAVFEYGKISLAEWINNNSDCEKMILVGKIFYDLAATHNAARVNSSGKWVLR